MRSANRRVPRSNSVSGGRVDKRAAMSPNAVARPRRDDQCRRRSAHDRRAEEDDVAGVGRLARRDVEVARVLLDRHRLARQGRLLDVEVSRLEEARVGRHPIPGRQPDDVTGDQIAPANLDPGARAKRGRRRRHDVAQSLRDAMGPIGLHEVEHHTQPHHEHDDGGVDPFAEDRGGGARDQQDDDQRIRQEQEDLNETGRARRARGLVRADLVEPPARVVGRQASA